MKAKFFIGLGVLSAVIIVNSCENKQAVTPLNVTVPQNCDTAKLRYSSDSNTMQPIINTYCAGTTGCHVSGGTAPTDYSTYASMQRYITGGANSQFYQHLFVLKDMPLGKPPLDNCTLDKFSIWLLGGAPQ